MKLARLFALLIAPLALLADANATYALYGPPGGGGGAEIVSVDNATDEQANAPSTDADVSGNGVYVVFQTEATNLFEDDGESAKEQAENEPAGTVREGGIFRYDRLTGQLQIVASGDLVVSEGAEEGKVLIRGAKDPSVSANGQYVAFESAQPLVSQTAEREQEAGHGSVDVYVRNMEAPHPAQEPGGYVLASALSGSEEAPVYEDSKFPKTAGGDPGTQVWPNTSISANGRYVLFRTAEVPSNFPAGGEPDTEPGQLFVRDLQEQTTTLVTQTSSGGAAGGSLGPATISADGSTVSWVGEHAPQQTPFVSGEVQNESTSYYLWRRWQEAGAKTRRITGIAEPENPECNSAVGVTLSPTAEGPCYGPLSYPESSLAGIDSQAPGLSANGYTVAFLAGSELRPEDTKPDALDVFLTSMAPGLTRKAATRELTLAVKNVQGNGAASITSLALSADGSHIAFVTQRNVFPLPEPEVLGTLSETAVQTELYVIDLTSDTLERAVLGLGEKQPNGSVENNPTLSENGSIAGFVSVASNLISGDANGVPDAFYASFEPPTGVGPGSAALNAREGGFSLDSEPVSELLVSVKRGSRAGEELLLVTAPQAGDLTVRADGTLPKAHAKRSTKKNKKRTGKATATRSTRKRVTLASAHGKAKPGSAATLVLRLSSQYRKALARDGRLEATAKIGFTPTTAAGEPLSDEVSLSFLSKKKGSKAKAKGNKKARTKTKGTKAKSVAGRYTGMIAAQGSIGEVVTKLRSNRKSPSRTTRTCINLVKRH